ncbi:MAG: hypothetical protein Ct9H300mP1_13430 [Planctomycetaceae bacterium]|nr:MAG: hypothetical protein Ct9H300mP1_13430 [Planctomycetaceae bacterium]
MSRRVGLESDYADVAAVFDEFTSLTRNYQGFTRDPRPPRGDSGRVRIRKTTTGPRFSLATVSQPQRPRSVRALSVPAGRRLPDDEYPFVSTPAGAGTLATGSMTRRSKAWMRLNPEAFVAFTRTI